MVLGQGPWASDCRAIHWKVLVFLHPLHSRRLPPLNRNMLVSNKHTEVFFLWLEYFLTSMFKVICFHSIAPSVTIRPQGSSPYKKAGILASGAAVPAKGRTIAPGPSTAPTVAVPSTAEDVSKIQVMLGTFPHEINTFTRHSNLGLCILMIRYWHHYAVISCKLLKLVLLFKNRVDFYKEVFCFLSELIHVYYCSTELKKTVASILFNS